MVRISRGELDAGYDADGTGGAGKMPERRARCTRIMGRRATIWESF